MVLGFLWLNKSTIQGPGVLQLLHVHILQGIILFPDFYICLEKMVTFSLLVSLHAISKWQTNK